MKRIFLTGLISFISFQLYGSVTWESTANSYQATVDDTKTDTVFKFTVTGNKPVKVVNVRASCGCTATTPPREAPYQPGEQGEIHATFTYGDRSGRQTKIITAEIAEVEADGTLGTPVPHNLTLTVDIPEILRIEPSFVFWQQGENTPKTARVVVGDVLPLKVNGIRVADPNIKARFKTITPDKEYEIELTPTEQAFTNGTSGQLLVDTSLENRRFTLFFNVQPPQTATANTGQNPGTVVSQPIQITIPSNAAATN